MSEIRFGEFVREMSVHQNEISFNDLSKTSSSGNAEKLKVTGRDVYRILGPYMGVRFTDQLRAVVPLAVYLVLFQIFILRQPIADAGLIGFGLMAVMLGLMLFMEGLKLGLMPFGEAIGTSLPVKSPLYMVLIIAFLLGVGVTFAEPAIGALKKAGELVNVLDAPYLFALLNNFSDVLVLVVGIGVGLATVFGTLRFVYNWSLKPLIYCSLLPVLLLTFIFSFLVPELASAIGVAWDCGAVTTGPVTVPLVLSLGIGVASSVGNGNNSLSGFGIVTLASLFPILGVLCLTLWLYMQFTPAEIVAMAQGASQVSGAAEAAWYSISPWNDIILAFRAIVPLVLFLFLVIRFVLKERVKNKGIIFYGLGLTVLGMSIFNLGLTYGLAKLGGQSGGLVPAAFTAIPSVADSPLYWVVLGIAIAIGFAFFLGFGATLAEPALNALGMTVQNLTNGAFKKSTLMYAVSGGVAIGISLGVGKLIFNWPMAYLLLPGYLGLLVLTYFSNEEFVNVAWDSAGVTTGPVTVPLVLSMGLGFGKATGLVEGFGILSMASLCPVVSVLLTGLYIQFKAKRMIKKVADMDGAIPMT